jgi:hypothetical protein
MRGFYVFDSADRLIGSVIAIDGDVAWLLARHAQPNAAYLKAA